MIIQPSTDLTPLKGARVVVDHARTVKILTARHCSDSPVEGLRDGFGGDCFEDPHGDCRGGNTAFWWPYGTVLTIAGEA